MYILRQVLAAPALDLPHGAVLVMKVIVLRVTIYVHVYICIYACMYVCVSYVKSRCVQLQGQLELYRRIQRGLYSREEAVSQVIRLESLYGRHAWYLWNILQTANPYALVWDPSISLGVCSPGVPGWCSMRGEGSPRAPARAHFTMAYWRLLEDRLSMLGPRSEESLVQYFGGVKKWTC